MPDGNQATGPAVEGVFLARPSFRVLRAGLLIFVLALCMRLPLALSRAPEAVSGSESINIVLSLVEHGRYADTFGPDSGPTAHCLPLNPMLQAAMLTLTGVGGLGAAFIIIMACAEISLAYALLPLLSRSCGLTAAPGVLAGLLGAALPLNFWAQSSGEFEYSLTALLLVAATCRVADAWVAGEPMSKARAAGTGCLMGLAALCSASAIPVFGLWGLFGLWRFRRGLRAYLTACAIAAALCLALLAPWALRNNAALGVPTWTRSNFGLELHLSNNDQATPLLAANMPVLKRLHPFHSREEQKKVRALGEYAYNRARLAEAEAWIAAHPGPFLSLTLQRMACLAVTPGDRPIQTLAGAVLTLLGVWGLVVLLRARHPAAWLFLGLLAGYPAVNLLIQVDGRYRFPIEWVLLLLGACALLTMRPRTERGIRDAAAIPLALSLGIMRYLTGIFGRTNPCPFPSTFLANSTCLSPAPSYRRS